MCGIVGYTGKNNCEKILLDCLLKLEYRGYDSAGIAIFDGEKINYKKSKGNIEKLQKAMQKTEFTGKTGIAHTRWATHGAPSLTNCHPHFNKDKTIAVVHNGIIENYEQLKKELIEKGYLFLSETDTEVLPHLIDYYYCGDITEAVIKSTKRLEGSYAIAVICSGNPDEIVVSKKDSPVIINVNDDCCYIASDIHAFSHTSGKNYILNDGETALLKCGVATFYDNENNRIQKTPSSIRFSRSLAEKNGFEHFMLKEIHEQPEAVSTTLMGRVNKDLSITLNCIDEQFVKETEKIYIAACGTAYHAGIAGKYIIERLSGITTDVEMASEFRYRKPKLNNKTLVIVISQSGETADTVAALRLAVSKGAKTLAITNVHESTVSREADRVFYTNAGPEIAVASTKAYLTQLTALYTIALFFAEQTGYSERPFIDEIKKELINITDKIKTTLLTENTIKKIAKKIHKESNVFYMGRGLDYPTALEGALKLKEITYIHSDTYAGGELKHGPIALIDKNSIVIAINTSKELYKKMNNNIIEVITRGANVTYVIPECFKSNDIATENVIYIPETLDLLYPLLSTVTLQLLAYYVAVYRGCDVDKPKNLAKSVTVE